MLLHVYFAYMHPLATSRTTKRRPEFGTTESTPSVEITLRDWIEG